MDLVYLEGVLMDNNEFICHGKSIFLTEEEVERFVRIKKLFKIKDETTQEK